VPARIPGSPNAAPAIAPAAPATDPALPPKPKFRGVLHQAAFFLAIPAGVVLVAFAPETTTARVAAAVYALSLAALFGASAAYHRGDWSPERLSIMRRLDHSMIFVLIAGTYTPVCLLVLPSPWSWVFLSVVWAGAAAGITLKILRIDGFARTSAALYITLGWVAIFALPFMVSRLPAVTMTLIAVGGVLYTVGAIVLASNRPNPSPTWFGYHEIWHSFTIAAGACHYIAIWLIVLLAGHGGVAARGGLG